MDKSIIYAFKVLLLRSGRGKIYDGFSKVEASVVFVIVVVCRSADHIAREKYRSAVLNAYKYFCTFLRHIFHRVNFLVSFLTLLWNVLKITRN